MSDLLVAPLTQKLSLAVFDACWLERSRFACWETGDQKVADLLVPHALGDGELDKDDLRHRPLANSNHCELLLSWM